MAVRTTSTANLDDLRKIWDDGCFLRPQPLPSTTQVADRASEDLFQGTRLRHANSVETLKEPLTASGVPEWWSSARQSPRKQEPSSAAATSRQREDVFGGSYDSGSGFYENTNLFNKRFSRFESAPSIFSGFVDDHRRSSSASTWEASSGESR